MREDYRIVPFGLGGVSMLVLTKVGSEPFIKELCTNGKTRGDASLIARSVKRLLISGQEWGFQSGGLKGPLHGVRGEIALYEVRCAKKRTVLRLMTYLHNDSERTPVFLFEFKGHQASESIGGIPPADLRRGEDLAVIARQLMKAKGEQQ
ncbi:MAG: hypothetical protein WAY93_09240 [Atopobiaceae bacterium]|nr:hypothetical protein [Atopobiaceae bacterium]